MEFISTIEKLSIIDIFLETALVVLINVVIVAHDASRGLLATILN